MQNDYSSYTSFCEKIDPIEFTNDKILEYSERKKKEGNEFYKKGEYWRAISEYKKAVMYLGKEWLVYKKEVKLLDAICWSNASSCYIHLKDYKNGLQCANTSLAHDPKNPKSLYRKALCLLELKMNTTEANNIISYLSKHFPNNEDVKKLTNKI
jgi:tetratricopeptide (TPR) repeat protein